MGAQPGGSFLPVKPGQSLVLGALRRARGRAALESCSHPLPRGEHPARGRERKPPFSKKWGQRESALARQCFQASQAPTADR